MNNRSILFLANAYPDFESSYRGIFIQKMALLLQQEEYEISVVTPKIYKESLSVEEHHGMKVYRFPFFSGEKLLIEHEKIPYLRMICYFISGVLFTVYALLKHRCQLIHVHWAIPTGLIGTLVGPLLKRPLVVTIHGSDLRIAMTTSSWMKRLFLFVCHQAIHLTCVSEVQKDAMVKLGIEERKISVFPMGIDESILKSGRQREKVKGGRPFTILSNRNLQPIYNLPLLIRAIPLILKEEPDTKVLIAGEGPDRKSLEKEATNLRIYPSIQFLGRVPHDKMVDLLAHVDVYVSTSLFDGTSVSLLEAMGSGAFPVVTDIPANREWIAHGENGFLVPPDKEKLLANRVLDALRSRSLAEKSRAKNISLVGERAVWPVSIRKVREIYEEYAALKP
jgi:glycosyltransferase involved in cell wall biosynthesis